MHHAHHTDAGIYTSGMVAENRKQLPHAIPKRDIVAINVNMCFIFFLSLKLNATVVTDYHWIIIRQHRHVDRENTPTYIRWVSCRDRRISFSTIYPHYNSWVNSIYCCVTCTHIRVYALFRRCTNQCNNFLSSFSSHLSCVRVCSLYL